MNNITREPNIEEAWVHRFLDEWMQYDPDPEDVDPGKVAALGRSLYGASSDSDAADIARLEWDKTGGSSCCTY